MKVVLSARAEADLDDIGRYIARDNPARANSFVGELFESCVTLAGMPYAFPLVERYEDSGIRRRGHGRYAIFYRVNADVIEIVAIIHGARDHERILLG